MPHTRMGKIDSSNAEPRQYQTSRESDRQPMLVMHTFCKKLPHNYPKTVEGLTFSKMLHYTDSPSTFENATSPLKANHPPTQGERVRPRTVHFQVPRGCHAEVVFENRKWRARRRHERAEGGPGMPGSDGSSQNEGRTNRGGRNRLARRSQRTVFQKGER